MSKLIAIGAFVALFASQASETPPERHFQLTGIGRFTYLVELQTIRHEADIVSLRSLQLTAEPMTIGGTDYLGGYSNWRFDCAGGTAQRLDYASLRSDLSEGPVTPTGSPPYEIAPGGDADELARVACGHIKPEISARSLNEALALAADDSDL